MYVLMTVIGITIPFIANLLGSAIAFCFEKEPSMRFKSLFLGFASGVMLAASVWSLLLPSIAQSEAAWGRFSFIPAAVGLLVGALFLAFFDKLVSSNKKLDLESQKTRKLFVAVTLHNIPEGLAVGLAFGSAWAIGAASAHFSALGLAIAMGLQNFPEGAAVALPIRSAIKSRSKGFLYGTLSGAVEPIFALVGLFLATVITRFQPWLLAFAAGAMIFIVAEELIPEAKNEDAQGETNVSYGAWGVIIGFTLMMILDVALG